MGLEAVEIVSLLASGCERRIAVVEDVLHEARLQGPGDVDQLERTANAVVVRILIGQGEPGLGARRQYGRRTEAEVPVLGAVYARDAVVDPAIGVAPASGQPDGQPVGQGKVGGGFQCVATVLELVAGARRRREQLARLAGDQRDGAQIGVLALKRALGALEELDAVQIEQAGGVEPPLPDEGAVQEQANRLIK